MIKSDSTRISQNTISPIRIGILGGGARSAVGYAHISALRMTGLFHLVGGMFSRERQSNIQSAQSYGVAPSGITESLEEFMEWAQENSIELIIVLTPTNQHFTQLKLLSTLNIPVVVEKALATSFEQGYELEETYKKRKIPNFVIFNYLGYPMLREVQNSVKTWHNQNIKSIRLTMPQDTFIRLNKEGIFTNPQDWRLKDYRISTISLDLGVHLYSILQYLLGKDIKFQELYFRNSNLGRIKGLVDDVCVIGKLSSGTTIDMWFSKVALGHKNGLSVRINGENEAFDWNQEFPDQITRADSSGALHVLRRGDSSLLVANQPRYTRFKGGHPAGFVEALANYYEDIAQSLTAIRLNRSTLTTSEFAAYSFNEANYGLKFFEEISPSNKSSIYI